MIDLSLAEMMSRRLPISIRIKQRRSRVRVWAAQSCAGESTVLRPPSPLTTSLPAINHTFRNTFLSPQDQVIKAAAVVLLRNADGQQRSADRPELITSHSREAGRLVDGLGVWREVWEAQGLRGQQHYVQGIRSSPRLNHCREVLYIFLCVCLNYQTALTP